MRVVLSPQSTVERFRRLQRRRRFFTSRPVFQTEQRPNLVPAVKDGRTEMPRIGRVHPDQQKARAYRL